MLEARARLPRAAARATFAVHHHCSRSRDSSVENLKLDEMANDRTWLSCTMILPLPKKVRPDRDPAGCDRRPYTICKK